MPLGFTIAQEDGSISAQKAAPSYSAYPLGNVQPAYDGFTGLSPTSTYESSRRPVVDRSSSSSTLLGDENYFSCMLPLPFELASL